MDSNLKLAAFPFSTIIPTKLALTLWIQQRPKERNRHFREQHQSDIFPFSTKAKVRDKDQIHLVPKIARPWGCSYPWLTLQGPLPAGPTRHSLPLLIDCQTPLCQTVSCFRKPCFSWCAPQIQFLSNFLPQVGSPGYREVDIFWSYAYRKNQIHTRFPWGLDYPEQPEEAPKEYKMWLSSEARATLETELTKKEQEAWCHFFPILT